MTIRAIATGVFLTIGSILDIKTRCIPKIYLYIFSAIILILSLFNTKLPFNEHLYGIIPGAIFLLISRLTNGAIGTGDSLVIALLGLVYGISLHIELLFITFGLLLFTSIAMVAFKKANKKTSLPMIPFISASFLISMIMHMGGV